MARIEGERYPILHKEYITPEGTLSTQVRKTDDWPDYWPYGDHVPFIDDLNIPRARKPLVAGPEDLGALKYLLGPPDEDAVEYFRTSSRANRELARELDLLMAYEWGILADMAGWLCSLEPLIYLAADQPDFVEELMQLIATGNLEMMQIVLDEGVDLWLRRAWYETCHFWTPTTYRQFILPHLKQEVQLAHSRGVKFGYIMTSGIMPLLDMILEAEVDVLIGVDPSLGGADLGALKEKTQGKMCLWGGVDGPVTVDRGTAEQVRKAVTEALDILAPGNGFILSPVDGIYGTSEHTWNNVREYIETWQAWG